MKNKKNVLIAISIIVIVLTTIIIMSVNTIMPKKTSEELFIKTIEDLDEFSTNLSKYMSGMADIMENELSLIINNEKNTIDLSKSDSFLNIRTQVEKSCNKIIKYNKWGLSKEMDDYINYAQKVAKDTSQFFNDINKEILQDDYLKILNDFSTEFSNDMNKLMELSSLTLSAYANSDDVN